MHNEEVIITVCDALGEESRYVFHEPEKCLIGRADDCAIRLPSEAPFMDISRHHCLLEIEPPRVFIGDLGSKNGTYVNGARLGLRRGRPSQGRPEEDAGTTPAPITELRDGDQIQLGRAALRLIVQIHAIEMQTA